MTDAQKVAEGLVHRTHCNQGEYVGSCKYGDEDCPAMTTNPPPADADLMGLAGLDARHLPQARAIADQLCAERQDFDLKDADDAEAWMYARNGAWLALSRTPSPVADGVLVERIDALIAKQENERGDYLDKGQADPELIEARAALQAMPLDTALVERVKERCASKAEEMGASYDTKENILLGIGALLRDAGSEIAAAIRQIEVKDVVGGGDG